MKNQLLTDRLPKIRMDLLRRFFVNDAKCSHIANITEAGKSLQAVPGGGR